MRRMNFPPSFTNLHISTDFVNSRFFLPFRKQHNAQCFSSSPYPLHSKCYSVASISSTPLRRTTNYQPSPWDDTQIQSLNITSFNGDVHVKRREELKEKVKWLIKEKGFADQLELFDLLQKLGVAYHFEEEIKDSLNLMKTSEEELRMDGLTKDVYAMALYFWLSREHGFVASKDLLVQSYQDEKGSYNPSVLHDTKGILSLYEASFLAMDGEEELDELKEFALKQLRYLMRSNTSTNPKLSEYIAKALELPLHHRIPKLQAPIFIQLARNIEEVNADPIVLELAQLDFNMTQSIYISELKEITSWWTKISSAAGGKVSFAREWPVESYFLAVGLAMEPQFSTLRKEVAKAICFINVIDDIYDIYGLLDELQHFTDAIERWEIAAVEALPEYMKICLSELFNMVNSLACKIMEEKGLDILPYLKRGWLDLCKAYMLEARWYYTEYHPTFEEYLDNAWISVAAPLTSVIAFCLSENLTKVSLESFEFYPSIVRQSSAIFRLYNDLGTSKGELRRGDVSKSIQCYMNERHVSESEAEECINNIISKCWKELNREWMKSSRYEEPFKTVVINLPRVGHLMYLQSNDRNVGELKLEKMKDNVISLLFEPITFKEG